MKKFCAWLAVIMVSGSSQSFAMDAKASNLIGQAVKKQNIPQLQNAC